MTLHIFGPLDDAVQQEGQPGWSPEQQYLGRRSVFHVVLPPSTSAAEPTHKICLAQPLRTRVRPDVRFAKEDDVLVLIPIGAVPRHNPGAPRDLGAVAPNDFSAGALCRGGCQVCPWQCWTCGRPRHSASAGSNSACTRTATCRGPPLPCQSTAEAFRI